MTNEDQRIIAAIVQDINRAIECIYEEYPHQDDKLHLLRHSNRSGVLLLKDDYNNEVEVEIRIVKRNGK